MKGGGGGVKYGIGLFKREEEWLILFWTKFFKGLFTVEINLLLLFCHMFDHKLPYALVFLPPEFYTRR